MLERLSELTWLNKPAPGIVEQWLERNKNRPQFSGVGALDVAVPLFTPFTKWAKWDGSLNISYSPAQVEMVKDGPPVPRPESKLWQIRQAYTESPEGQADFNGPKGHLHSFRVTPDGRLILRISDYDWHGMKALGLALRDGTLPERYRDSLLPTRRGNTFTFRSACPNNTNSHCVVITTDNHLILATRGQAVDYYQGHTAATIEQQTNPETDNSPFDSFISATSKLSKMAELNLTPLPETLRLGAIFLEPDVNCTAFLIVGKVEENSSQINRGIIGEQRADEFSPAGNSVWTLPLDQPDQLIQQFYHPREYLWHGTARLRIVAALAYTLGYKEAINRLYRGSPENTQRPI